MKVFNNYIQAYYSPCQSYFTHIHSVMSTCLQTRYCHDA